MMLRAVVRVVLPVAVATSLCFHGMAQTAPDAPSPVQSAPTIGASTNLSADSNTLASLYGMPVEQIIVRVNDQAITNSDVTRAQTQLDQEARQNNWTLEQVKEGQSTLLRDLIDQQLLISKGKQLGITGDTELIKRLDEIRKENHLDSLDDLQKAVEQQGISYEDFKANIRNSIITQQVVRDQVGSKIQISDAEMRAYYNDHKADFTHEETVHLNEILIPTSDNSTSAELADADAQTKDLEAKLKAGASFTDLAKKYSKGPTAAQGGDLGDFRRGALAKVLEDQTFDLPVGGHTAPIRTRQGYIILQVTEHIPGGTQPMQKVIPQIEQAIYMEKIGPAVRTYLT
ncbi:MAG: peptidylprolyl isomerase, partial [Acidobacteriaceae bacterium]